MYPLNVSNGVGYAVANTEDEHKRLTEMGYSPAYEGPKAPDKDALVAEAEALGIDVDKRWGVDRLAEEIAKAKQ